MFVYWLLLLNHNLYTVSVESQDATFKQKFSSHLDESWIQKPLILQCVFEASLLIEGVLKCIVTLSDNESTLSFDSTQLVKKFQLMPLGMWRGSIATLSSTKNVLTNFTDLCSLRTEVKKTILALETHFFASHYRIRPESILAVASGDIHILW